MKARHPRTGLGVTGLVAALVVVALSAGLWAQETRTLTAPERLPGVREIVVASPRAAIAWAVPRPPHVGPEATTMEELPRFQVGAAENFAATRIAIVVRKDSVVRFRESRQIEGVWYDDAFGRLGTILLVQMRNPTDATPEWITLGRDGAGAIRRGPSIGTARVSVPVRFPRVGEYQLRAIVVTGAIPMGPVVGATDTEPVDSPYYDIDLDVIPIRVKVVEILDPAALGAQLIPRGPDLGFSEPLERMPLE